MPVRRTVFRIETQLPGARSNVAETAAPPPQQILRELAALRNLVEGRRDSAPKIDPKIGADNAGARGIDTSGLRQLKDETDTIHRAIIRTKQEIAALHVNGLNRPESGRVFRELDAVVGGQELAIQQILAAAEDIDEAANTLSAALRHDQDQALAQDIRDQVIRIFEACNFQDLAGQRITTVLTTLKFVEDRIARMMEVWGGIEAFTDFNAAALAERDPGPGLLNGPKLEGDKGHASQADIDALFA
jgi:chemotaxis protein CheZ